MKSAKAVAGVALAAFASTAEAALASSCVGSNKNVCFQWGLPGAAAKSGSGNLYFQLRAPTTYSWFALGAGSGMEGASIFVVYSNGKNNITLSTRGGEGHIMPGYTPRSDVELLEGSGIVGGNMVANVRCNSCSDLDLGSTSNWIAAWKEGSPINSASPSADITQHDDHSQFTVDIQQATITSDSNPFLSKSHKSGTDGAGSQPSGSQPSGGDSNGGNSNDDNGPNDSEPSSSSSGVSVKQDDDSNLILQHAHGVVMAIVFLGGYPIGSSLMPLIGNWILHASWQFLAFLGMWAGFGIGYTVATNTGVRFDDDHTKLGTIVCALMGLQPILGWLHHKYFVKNQKRGVVSHIHIWYGRGLMILGIVNGGLGLQAANQSTPFVVAYAVIAGVVAAVYTGSLAVGISRRRKHIVEKDTSSRPTSEDDDGERSPVSGERRVE